MPPSYFPLRWESTGDQWWYASPIDWAAANGLFDLVIELLHLDTNLLIKLTSLRRIRRLETVWDDEALFDDVAKCRSLVARKLLRECETTKKGGDKNNNTLIRAGYGGWLLYTAASAGDVDFVKELLERDPFLVFGEGEYGVTDVFYAAARGGNSEVFRKLLDFAVSSRSCLSSCSAEGEEVGDKLSESNSVFKWEMMNRAVHAAARGGSLKILREILKDCGDVLVYRDVQGSTILHSASGRGQVEVVKDLVASFNIITSTDNQGNTALHVASYRGYLKVVEFLIHASPSLASVKNNSGNTFLHMVVAGFRTPGFQRKDRQIELMKQLVCGGIAENIQGIINVRNSDGRTALHMAVTENVQSDLVELIVTVKSIDLNVRDADGMTPLDLLKRVRPKSASSQILIKELIAAGGTISKCRRQDNVARSAIVSHLRGRQGIGGSPGTSFRIPDAEIFLYTGSENTSYDAGYSSCQSELSGMNLSNSSDNKKSSSINRTAKRLKYLLQWPGKKERKAGRVDADGDPLEAEVMSSCRNWSDGHIPLRQKYSKNNKFRAFSVRSDLPSRSTRKKFTTGLSHGVIQAAADPFESPPSPFSGSNSFCSNPSFNGKTAHEMNQYQKQTSIDKRLMMNQYFCFGAQGLAVDGNKSYTRLDRSIKSASSLVA